MVTEFTLLGLSNHRELGVPLFSIYLLFYTITLTGNILLITITMDPAFHPHVFLSPGLILLHLGHCPQDAGELPLGGQEHFLHGLCCTNGFPALPWGF